MNKHRINVIIPMAGSGSRFANKGYTVPKPFIDVNGKMMIERVLDGLCYDHARYILIVQQQFWHQNADQLATLSKKYPLEFVTVEKLTRGAACTALAAHRFINNKQMVIFADCDNIFDNSCFAEFVADAKSRKLDGSLMTFSSQNPCFSFIEVNEEGLGIRTREKQVISSHAIAGLYLFKRGSDFVNNTIDMLIYGDTVKGEFYMSNVYNYAISQGRKIGIYTVNVDGWNCVGTPSQLKAYLVKTA